MEQIDSKEVEQTTSFEAEAKEQIKAALERGDFDIIREILDAMESAENPNIVRVEFTTSEMKFLEKVKGDLMGTAPDIPSVLRMILMNFKPGYLAALKKQRKN